MTECVFCNRTDAIIENDLAQVICDNIPFSKQVGLGVQRTARYGR